MAYDSSLLLRLGNVMERIEENYSSEKLFLAADLPLYTGLEILLRHTTLVEEFLAAYLVYPTRKMLYGLKDEDAVKEHFYELFTGRGGRRVKHVRALYLNRELLAFPLVYVTGHVTPYTRAVAAGSDDARHIMSLLCWSKTDKDITPELLRIQAEYERFLLMRESIIEKYHRLLVKEVRRDGPAGLLYAEDMALEYYCALLRSFARFDPRSGTYTSYVTSWFKNAKSVARGGLELGTAFSIPNNIRVKIARGESDLVNYAVPEDRANLDALHTRNPFDLDGFDTDALNQIISYYDTAGLYRMINDLAFDPKYLLEQGSLGEFDETQAQIGTSRVRPEA